MHRRAAFRQGTGFLTRSRQSCGVDCMGRRHPSTFTLAAALRKRSLRTATTCRKSVAVAEVASTLPNANALWEALIPRGVSVQPSDSAWTSTWGSRIRFPKAARRGPRNWYGLNCLSRHAARLVSASEGRVDHRRHADLHSSVWIPDH